MGFWCLFFFVRGWGCLFRVVFVFPFPCGEGRRCVFWKWTGESGTLYFYLESLCTFKSPFIPELLCLVGIVPL